MRFLDPSPPPPVPNGRGIVLGAACPVGKTKQRRRQSEPQLEIAEDIFGEETVKALLDKWIIPAIADGLIRDIMNSAGVDKR